MLTKEDRAAITERIKDIDVFNERTFYTAITDKRVPEETSCREDLETIAQVIIDLCDTSNMIGLPLDKDGQVINVGDTVYVDDREWQVSCIKYSDQSPIITVYSDIGCTVYRPDELTHKKPVTIRSLVEELRSTLCAAYISGRECEKILHIADQLESLGDSND